nr:MAG TPA: Helix-turn-helix XRE-family like protein [Caudoviricetes sp.]
MDSENATLLCSRLKELRSSLNLTQKEFAERIGASTVSISSYEIGAKTPSLEMLLTIAKTFNVSLDWLCGLSDMQNRPGEIITYADLIKSILSILKSENLDADIMFSESPDDYDFPPSLTSYSFPYIYINDEKISTFFSEWQEMTRLLKNNIIKEDLFNLWLNDKLSSLSMPISKHNCIAEKGLPLA